MTLSGEALHQRRERFLKRTAQFLSLGFDRFAAAAFVAEGAGEGPGEALDVGTGNGFLAMALARRGFRVVSVDVDGEEQALASALARETELQEWISFEMADAALLPYADGRFDVVASMDALHHFSAGEPILEEMIRVMRPGGRLVLAEFTEDGFSLVESVHVGEGLVHARGEVTLEWVSGFLAGRGFSLEGRAGNHQQDRRTFQSVPCTGTMGKPLEAPGSAFEAMGREDLLDALRVFAKNWLAHDGCWFLAAEERFGLETAMNLDAASWKCFAQVEAKRIKESFQIEASGGLDALARALSFRMYALVNRQHLEWLRGGSVLRFVMDRCRVQEARRRKGLPAFPCRTVGETEFVTFARTIDPSIVTRCVHCPPDPNEAGACTWEFELAASANGGPAERRTP
jgi:ubiquinone/menaquinone biosynthesis C-methylase UbiE